MFTSVQLVSSKSRLALSEATENLVNVEIEPILGVHRNIGVGVVHRLLVKTISELDESMQRIDLVQVFKPVFGPAIITNIKKLRSSKIT
ncbi:hypothetical protein ESZ50_10400 [Weissella muntiaci]|uniref:Uncharacterized protein n=1 Tax=Weissella muntiaci TaxID=2508881 RepID=A0A6C2C3T2_9LACO|nr:hypothetical protein [Weissella muntiaci]TYC47915.1 hypothetical protein ESZ50_10400 [Weissella muntiaci]